MKPVVRYLCFAAVALALLGLPGHSAPMSPDAERIQKLEERLGDLEEIVKDPEGTVKTTESNVKKLQKLTLSGYLQGRFQHNENSQSGTSVVDDFYLRRARLKMTARPSAEVIAVISFDGAKGFELKDAFITWIPGGVPEQTPAFTLGQQNWCFGREVPVSSSVRECPERALFARTLFAGERDLGFKVTSAAGLPYLLEVGVFNGAGINKRDTNQGKDIVGRLGLSPTETLDVGVSGYFGTTWKPSVLSSLSGRNLVKNRYGCDVAWLVANGLVLKAEGVYARELGANPWGFLAQLAKNLSAKTVLVFRFDEFNYDGLAKAERTRTINAGLIQHLTPNLKGKLFYESPRDKVGDVRDDRVIAEALVAF